MRDGEDLRATAAKGGRIVGLVADEMNIEKGGMSDGHVMVVPKIEGTAVPGDRLEIGEVTLERKGISGSISSRLRVMQMFDAVCIAENIVYEGQIVEICGVAE